MDYEKKYKNLLAKAKEFEFQGYIDEECLYDMFPELREESEDERIRKALIKYYSFDKDGGSHALDNITPKQIVTWLKKQGETFTKKDVDDAYLRGISDTKNEIEKQYEANYQIRKDIATFLFNYRGDIKDRAKWIDYLGIKVSFVEEQGEQKKTPIEGEFPYDNPSDTLEGEIENIWGKLSSGGRFSATKEGFREVITHFANYIKEQDDRELVEQKTEWSEEDETVLNNLIYALANDRIGNNRDEYVNWLKSLRPQRNVGYNPYKAVVESIAEMCKHYDTASHLQLRDFYDNVKVKCKESIEYDKEHSQNQWQRNSIWHDASEIPEDRSEKAKKKKNLDRAVEAFRWCCPHSTPCRRLDGTTYVSSCWEFKSSEHGFKCEGRTCKRLRRFINILKEPEQ